MLADAHWTIMWTPYLIPMILGCGQNQFEGIPFIPPVKGKNWKRLKGYRLLPRKTLEKIKNIDNSKLPLASMHNDTQILNNILSPRRN